MRRALCYDDDDDDDHYHFSISFRILKSKSESRDKLNHLILQIRHALRAQQISSVTCEEEDTFDWFVAVVFLIFRGEVGETAHFLLSLSQLQHSAYLWMARLKYTVSKMIIATVEVRNELVTSH